jgi:hypothetical protein
LQHGKLRLRTLAALTSLPHRHGLTSAGCGRQEGPTRKPTIAPPSKLHPRTLAACRVRAGCTSGERQPGGSSAITPNGRAISAKAPPRLKRRSRGLGGLSADESADRRTRSRSKTSPASRLDKCSSLHHDRSTCELARADTQADGEIVGCRRTQCRCPP